MREAAAALLSDQLITAEQDERRRLALFLHDGAGAVAGRDRADARRRRARDRRPTGSSEAKTAARLRARPAPRRRSASCATSRSTSSRSCCATRASARRCARSAEQIGISHGIQIDLDVDAGGGARREGAGRALPDHPRGARPARSAAARRRGSPSASARGGRRDGDRRSPTTRAGERRRTSFDAIAERARAINGRLGVEPGEDGGTTVRVDLPAYTV